MQERYISSEIDMHLIISIHCYLLLRKTAIASNFSIKLTANNALVKYSKNLNLNPVKNPSIPPCLYMFLNV